MISGRGGEIQQLNFLRVYGQFMTKTGEFCGTGAAFIVSTVETVAGSSNVNSLRNTRFKQV